MAKYRKTIVTDAIAIGDEYFGSGKKSNQSSKGVIDKPNYSTDPAGDYGKKGKLCFHSMVAKGESPNDGDVNCIGPNGVSSSKGQGFNQSRNWWKGSDGHWNKNVDWDGANRTGE